MTSSEVRPVTAAGVFVVRDPAVCAALEQLLVPHRTDSTDDGSAAIAKLMADAEARAAELTGEPTGHLPPDTTIEQLLDYVHRDGQDLSKDSLAEAQDQRGTLNTRLSDAEAALHRADGELTATSGLLQDALAKIAELEARPAGRRPNVSVARNSDQKAFVALADRLDREALSQPQTPATVLRLASKAVRDEISIVYGNAERKAP